MGGDKKTGKQVKGVPAGGFVKALPQPGKLEVLQAAMLAQKEEVRGGKGGLEKVRRHSQMKRRVVCCHTGTIE